MKKIILLSVLSLSLFTSCQKELDTISFLANEDALAISFFHLENGDPDMNLATFTEKSSKPFINLNDWLVKHPDGWKKTHDRHKFAIVNIVGNNFRIMIYDTYVVIALRNDKGTNDYYKRDYEEGDFAFLMGRFKHLKNENLE